MKTMGPTLLLCPVCGEHAHIVLDNGGVGPEMTSRNFARTCVDNGVLWRKFSKEEGEVLKRDIERLHLPEQEDGSKPELYNAVVEWMKHRIAYPDTTNGSFDSFHKFWTGLSN